ncbi:MAG: transporter [Bacteroidales bacterium]
MKSKILVFTGLLLLVNVGMAAQGISTDAGLTPAQDRWMVRSQLRMMGMENSMMQMNTTMVPVVVGYGITSGSTVMLRNMYVRQNSSNSAEVNSGVNDPYLLAKFRLYRKNTANFTFGMAPYFASNIPVGASEISNRSWDPEVGLNLSFRPRFLAVDISTSYVFNDAMEKINAEHLNKYNFNLAVAGIMPFKKRPDQALSPVIELNYSREGNQNSIVRTRELLFLSPGFSYIISSLFIEALYQVPVYQSERTDLMTQRPRWILGLKYML